MKKTPPIDSKMKHIHTFPPDELIVGMLEYNNTIFIATQKCIYTITEENTLKPLTIYKKEE